MKIFSFEECNVIFGKSQDQYIPLPARREANGLVMYCLELDNDEIEEVVETRTLHFTFLTFGGPVQPFRVDINKPKIPLDYTLKFECNTKIWGDSKESPATFRIKLTQKDLRVLKKTRLLWVTTCTFMSPFQPISMTITQNSYK